MKSYMNIISTLILVCTMLFCLKSATSQDSVVYKKGGTINFMIPIVFSANDLGKAYPKTVTGLKGDRSLRGDVKKKDSSYLVTNFYKIEDDFTLNVIGTGKGMYRKKLEINPKIRRANLSILKIDKQAKILNTSYDESQKNISKPLCLTEIYFGKGINVSIIGSTSVFTEDVFEELKTCVYNGQSINHLIEKYELILTYDLRGVRPKTGRAKLPADWEDLKLKYELIEDVPVWGQYFLLSDVIAQKIEWK